MDTKQKVDASKIDTEEEEALSPSQNKKTCFIIMPIADHPDYEEGHFDRVYNFLIKPACEKAGYLAIRADDSKASHMIMFDILKKIVECDMAICDLSTKNANVFYELGLRQAFNKKTILITDGKERAPFDITGFRYVQYSPSLRIDAVHEDISNIKNMLNETETASDSDVNSIVKLLEIKPAKIQPKELNEHESIIFDMFNKLNEKIDRISNHSLTQTKEYINNDSVSLFDLLKNRDINPYDYKYVKDGEELGHLAGITKAKVSFEKPKFPDTWLDIPAKREQLKSIFIKKE